MATLALSVVGAGLGQITGIGASTGWMLGSTLGRLISPMGAPSRECLAPCG